MVATLVERADAPLQYRSLDTSWFLKCLANKPFDKVHCKN